MRARRTDSYRQASRNGNNAAVLRRIAYYRDSSVKKLIVNIYCLNVINIQACKKNISALNLFPSVLVIIRFLREGLCKFQNLVKLFVLKVAGGFFGVYEITHCPRECKIKCALLITVLQKCAVRICIS